ncbi:MAG: LamG-like jellyroll fold domain-containing protein [Cystobacter sp.]
MTAAPAVRATEYYVSPTGSDSNPGTESYPWRQISRANLTVTAGDTVKVAPGDYDGGFTTSVNGSATARITYVSTSRGGARINVDPNSTAKKKDHGWKNTGEYVTIDGFEIDGTAENTWRFGIYSSGNHSLITRNHVHHIADEYPECSSAGGAGIEGDNWDIPDNVVDTIDVTDNLVHHIGPFAKAPCNYYQGIYLIASGKVQNNIVYKVVSWGMSGWHDAGNNDISNNVVTDCGSGGIAVGAGGSGSTPTSGDYFNVSNNIVYKNSNYGIIEGSSSILGTHNTFTNNLVRDSGTNWRLIKQESINSQATGNNISAEPLFVGYIPGGGGDYHLQSGSLARNAGSATYAPPKDHDGVQRPQGSAVDIGAYEYQDVSTSGPTLWWKFDEGSGTSISDASGNAHTGTLQGDASRVAGRLGSAVNLGNTGKGVLNTSTPADVTTGDFSLSGWVNLNALPFAWSSLINKGGSGSAGYGLEVDPSNRLTASLQGSSGTNQHVVGTTVLASGQWYHAAAVFKRNDKVYLYLNGALQTSATYATGNTGSLSNTKPFTLGSYSNATTWHLPGRVDSVRMYHRALTAAEVSALYANGN